MDQLIAMENPNVIILRAYNQLLVAITVKVTKSQSTDIVPGHLQTSKQGRNVTHKKNGIDVLPILPYNVSGIPIAPTGNINHIE